MSCSNLYNSSAASLNLFEMNRYRLETIFPEDLSPNELWGRV